MSPDLAFKSVDGAHAEGDLPGHFADANTPGQLPPRTLDLVRFGTRTTQLCAHNAPLALELAVAGELVLDNIQPSPDKLADHGAFKLAEGARDVEQQFAGRRGRVDILLV